MSFLKIKDPAERERVVKEFLEIKKNIRANELAEKTGKIELREDLSELFKPITEAQKTTAKEITEGLRPIKEGIEQLPRAIKFKAFPSIKAYSQEGLTDEEIEEIKYFTKKEDDDPFLLIGPLAAQQLRRYTIKNEADTTYGIYDKKGTFYIGSEPIEILGNDILVANKTYEGTPSLWELIVARKPDKSIYDDEDFYHYKEIMEKTNTLRQNHDPKSKSPKSSKSWKWKNLLTDVWKDTMFYGSGIVIPSDPNALLERLDLLIASKAAGHTGLRNELVSVCDELKRQGVFGNKTYKRVMSLL